MPRGFSGGGGDLHYTKSGDLDMRYTSSREAVASEFSSYPSAEEVSYNDLGSGYSSYGEELHYKQDGTLDMRYTSSREASGYEAVASEFSSYPSAEEVSYNDLGSGYSSYGEELHYKKDGTLDMRYTSSREASGYEAVASEFSSYPSAEVSSNDLGSGYSSHGEELHYKKDGTLDMRYTSSREASGYPSGSASSSSSSDPLHYKQDGALDMRYSSSKDAAATAEFNTSTGDDLHFKKDGSLDMRFNSSKIAGQPVASSQSGDLHYKKDGSLDMRYNSSKVASGLSNDLKKMQLISSKTGISAQVCDVPENVTLKADGTPDMRTNAGKEWVASQAAKWDGSNESIPSWVPKNKDGAVKLKSTVGRAFMKGTISHVNPQPSNLRSDYWRKRLANEKFLQSVEAQRKRNVVLPPRPSVINTQLLRQQTQTSPAAPASRAPLLSGGTGWTQTSPAAPASRAPLLSGGTGRTQTSPAAPASRAQLLPGGTVRIDYSSLKFDDDEKAAELGKGSFGVVMRATLNGKTVAVKKLHLDRLTKKEKGSFDKELRILTLLGTHPNLVELYAYCLNPLCLVMELVKLGSLSYLLYYCDDPAVEAAMTDGRRKKNILFGIAHGMLQLHSSKIVHGDLKPQNVLISEEYEAKISDFGLATFRGKSSSTIASSRMVDDDDDENGVLGGTAGYMAPELLDSPSPPEFSSDVYSFGVLTNELIAEEEPYYDQYINFVGRGPFGAANYAKQGKRPRISDETPDSVKQLITKCWEPDPHLRPSFEQITVIIEEEAFMIPNKVSLH